MWNRNCAPALAVLAGLMSGCAAPDAVSKFCASAVTTLKSGDAVFDDMKQSCIRETESRKPFGKFIAGETTPPDCAEIGKQAEGLEAATRVLAAYYSALNDLAAFGMAKPAADAAGLASRAAAMSGMKAEPQKAIKSVAGLLVSMTTSGYQRRRLQQDVVRVNGDIQAVLAGLDEMVRVAYLNLLADEQEKLAARYQEFLLDHNSPEAMLVLDARWQSDGAQYASRRSAALAFATALETLAKGNQALADHSHKLDAKELPGLLSPYAAQLDDAALAVRKVF
jgi:hypothetical protein